MRLFLTFVLLIGFLFPYTFAEEITSETFPTSDEVLLKIWEKRPDLQRVYPEVKDGDFDGIKNWAKH